jgi:hypothetical protein
LAVTGIEERRKPRILHTYFNDDGRKTRWHVKTAHVDSYSKMLFEECLNPVIVIDSQ